MPGSEQFVSRVLLQTKGLIGALTCSLIVVGGRHHGINAQSPSFRSGVDVVALAVGSTALYNAVYIALTGVLRAREVARVGQPTRRSIRCGP
jgi:hypothetical protein